ncbi:MAG: PIG-L family deacetylase [Gemmatimonadetes bacterium]|nr:PIG-L family deacetylase [Gemmatimonadota bacterium]
MIRYDAQVVLVLAPHADDETLGCGGIIQKFAAAGSAVHLRIVSFFRGEDRRYDKDREAYRSVDSDERMRELRRAAEILGAASVDVFFWDDPAAPQWLHRLDGHSVGEVLPAAEACVRELRPTVILTPAPSKNQDHAFVHTLTRTLVRPYFCNASVLAYEVDGELDFRPDFFVPLSEAEVERKLAAVDAYATQRSPERHPTSARAIRARMIVRGSECFADYAEAFEVVRIVG